MVFIKFLQIILFGMCCLYKNHEVQSFGYNSFIEHCSEERPDEALECDLVKFLVPFNISTMRLSGIAIGYDQNQRFQKIYFGTGNCIQRDRGTYLRLLPNAVWHIYPQKTVIVVISPTIGPMSFFLEEEAEVEIEFPNTHVFILNGELKTYGAKRRCVVPNPDMNGVSMYHFNPLNVDASHKDSKEKVIKVHREKLFIGQKHNQRCLREQREDEFPEINVIKRFENLIPEYFTQCRLKCDDKTTQLIVARNLTRRYRDPDAGKKGDLIFYHLNDTHNNNTFKPNVNQMETILYDQDEDQQLDPKSAPIAQNWIQDGSKVEFDSDGGKITRKRSPLPLRTNSKSNGNIFRDSENDLRGGQEPLSYQLDPVMNSRYEMWRGKKDINRIIPYEAASLEEFEKDRIRIYKRLTLSSMMRLKNAAAPRKAQRELICYIDKS